MNSRGHREFGENKRTRGYVLGAGAKRKRERGRLQRRIKDTETRTASSGGSEVVGDVRISGATSIMGGRHRLDTVGNEEVEGVKN